MSAKRILVIDDEEILRLMVRDVLALEGHEVDVASSGEEGLEAFGGAAYDLVVTDNNMPGIEGLEVLRRIREANPDVPVILMTAFGSLQVSMQAHELGAAGYLLKPFDDISAITREVSRVFARLEREQSLRKKLTK